MSSLEEKILSLKTQINYEEGRMPIYTQLADMIKLVIKSGVCKEGDRLPSERVMSSCFGIARNTLRKTVSELIEEGYLEKYQGKGIFVKKNYMGGMNVAILYVNGYFDIGGPMNREHIRGIKDALKDRSYTLDYIGIDDNFSDDKLVSVINEKKINYLISFIMENKVNDRIKELLPNMPFVSKLSNTSSAFIDLNRAVEQQFEYLYSMGHRHIAYNFVSPLRDQTAMKRETYRLLCEKYCIASYEFESNDYTMESGRDTVKEIVRRGKITAVIAGDDYVAMGMLRGLKDMGLSCPEDLSVVGIGNYDICRFTIPSLTTLAMPYYEIGIRMASYFYDNSEDTGVPKKDVRLLGVADKPLFTSLAERESVKKI
ncbi:MAG: GntR family transcriptional regulator [Armatimonadetes bacterium]|nr:GntR family transcriptional regulator [Candidatus Hippobium faecium]